MFININRQNFSLSNINSKIYMKNYKYFKIISCFKVLITNKKTNKLVYFIIKNYL